MSDTEAQTPRLSGIVMHGEIRLSDPENPDSDPIIPVHYLTADKVLSGLNCLMLYPKAEIIKAAGSGIGGGWNADHKTGALERFGQCVAEKAIQDGDKTYIVSDVQLFTSDPRFQPEAGRAHGLIDRKILKFVSAEVLPESVTCSICGHSRLWSDDSNRCAHTTKKNLGRKFNGKLAYEIAHDLKFYGGAFTNFPADDEAEILKFQAAQSAPDVEPEPDTTQNEGGLEMSLNVQGQAGAEGAAANQQQTVSEPEAPQAPEATPAQQAAGTDPSPQTDASSNAAESPVEPPPDAPPAPQVDTTPPNVEGMTVEQKAALCDDLVAKLTLADMEVKRLTEEKWAIDRQLWEAKRQLRQGEINSVIESMKASGHVFGDGEEEVLRKQLDEMNDAVFAGYKAGVTMFSSKVGKPAQMAAKPTPVATHVARPAMQSAKPVNIPDDLNRHSDPAAKSEEFRKAFNVPQTKSSK